ncbi:MAG TPA: hypothetical protein DCX95_06125 [Elusimicrobia bacterium]|nr:hypothetical protein [Elusimicrobiota bacterium]
MKYSRALKYVKNLGEFSYNFDLTRIRNFLEKLGTPQDKIKIIHVAGTNGKGSVCAYISTVLQKAGYKVGLYTSPHLLDIRERIQINRIKIPKKDFAEFIARYSLLVTRYHLTYFELLTSLAFWYFERKKVDFAVIEVGLGGRLDATNVIKKPLVSVITNISLEHTQYLGNTVSKIAREKAGIIKKNGIVITGTSGVALRTIEKIAKSKNTKLIRINNHENTKQQNFNYKIVEKVPKEVILSEAKNLLPTKSEMLHCVQHDKTKVFQRSHYKISLFGEHQKENARLASAVCRYLDIPEKQIIDGIKKTRWPARFEVIPITDYRLPVTAVLDVAHNPSGIKVLKDSIKKYFGKKINFVFGVLADKDYKEMIKTISSVAKNVFISAPLNNRALSSQIVRKEFLKYILPRNVFIFSSIKKAIKSAIVQKENFCITGSTYTVSEAITAIKN